MDFIGIMNEKAAEVVALGWAIVWQSTVLAAVVAVAARTLARRSASARFWLWQAVAFKLLLMPFWAVAVPAWPARAVVGPVATLGMADSSGTMTVEPWPGPTPGGSAESTPRAVPVRGGWPSLRAVSWASWLVLAWAGLVVAQFGHLVRQWRRLTRLLDRASPLADPALLGLIAEASARLGLQNQPRAVVAEFAGSPFVCGATRPTLVLPSRLIEALNPARWRAVLLHELAHVRRGDLIWGWIPELAKRAYPFHPVAYWVAYQSRLERELACDAIALRHGGGDAPGYAMTLVDVISLSSPHPSPNAKEPTR